MNAPWKEQGSRTGDFPKQSLPFLENPYGDITDNVHMSFYDLACSISTDAV